MKAIYKVCSTPLYNDVEETVEIEWLTRELEPIYCTYCGKKLITIREEEVDE